MSVGNCLRVSAGVLGSVCATMTRGPEHQDAASAAAALKGALATVAADGAVAETGVGTDLGGRNDTGAVITFGLARLDGRHGDGGVGMALRAAIAGAAAAAISMGTVTAGTSARWACCINIHWWRLVARVESVVTAAVD